MHNIHIELELITVSAAVIAFTVSILSDGGQSNIT